MANPAAARAAASAGSDPGLICRLGWLVLATAFGLRAWLAGHGGQMFWPDEDRFVASQYAVGALAHGEWRRFAELLFGQPDHLLFKLFGLVPAGIEHAFATGPWAPALCFAAVSTWMLWLVRRTALAAGGSETEGLLALLFAACTNCLFYYSRHYFPYDLALCCLLLALCAVLRQPPGRRGSFFAGFWAALGFMAYNGYWTLTAAVALLHLVLVLSRGRLVAASLAYAVMGALAPVLVIVGAGRLLGHDLIALAVEFAGTVMQGDLGRARFFLPEYGWVSEHGLVFLWAAAIPAGLLAAAFRRDPRLLLWPVFCLLLAALLILPSDLLSRFAVSARHARVLAPFLCLATASTLCALATPRTGRWLLGAGAAFAVLQAGGNFARPLAQVFPREFEREAIALLATARQTDLGPYRLVNATFLHDPRWAAAGPDAGVVLLRRPHPIDFAPYLHEGYSEPLRDGFRARELTMRVVRLAAGGPPFRGYPAGLIDLTLQFPESPLSLLPEPLLGTGAEGVGDLLFMKFEDATHFRLGYDHIGGGGVYSQVLALDRTRPHRLQVCFGSFFPPGSPFAQRLFVKWDDTVVFHQEAAFHPSTPGQIAIGHNSIGASTAILQSMAAITKVAYVPLPGPGIFATNPSGTFSLQLQLPPAGNGAYSLPLVSSGRRDRGDLLFLRTDGHGRFQIGHDHQGAEILLSEPFPLDPAQPVDLVLGIGALAGGTGRPSSLFVACNGSVIFNREREFHPSAPAEVWIGENRPGLSTAAATMPAQLLSWAMLPAGPQPARDLPFPGIVRMQFRPLGPVVPGRAEPLLCTGVTGAADLLFVQYDGLGHATIGLDHWGYGARVSPPVALGPDGRLDLVIAMGPLFPPPGSPATPPPGEPERWRHRLLVMSGSRILLNDTVPYHPFAGGPVRIGLNPVGASTTGPELRADLLGFEQLSAEEISSLPPLP